MLYTCREHWLPLPKEGGYLFRPKDQSVRLWWRCVQHGVKANLVRTLNYSCTIIWNQEFLKDVIADCIKTVLFARWQHSWQRIVLSEPF